MGIKTVHGQNRGCRREQENRGKRMHKNQRIILKAIIINEERFKQ
jgi:hypothetical protein